MCIKTNKIKLRFNKMDKTFNKMGRNISACKKG